MANQYTKSNRAKIRAVGAGNKLRCVIYLRCSTDDQAKGDFSTIDSQRQITLQHIAAIGAVFGGEFSDEGVSGTNPERPGINALIREAQSGTIDAVVVSYMSRLGRGDAFPVLEFLLKKAGVKVLLVRENFTDDVSGYAARKMTNLMDGMYSEQVRQHTIAKMEQMFLQGYFVGGGIPFGYHTVPAVDGGSLIADGKTPRKMAPSPDTAPLIVRCYETLLTTGFVADVRDYLNAATGKAWGYKQTLYLLTNRTYLGEASWRHLIAAEHHEAILSQSLFEAVQDSLAKSAEGRERRTRRAVPQSSNEYRYLLRGQVFCGVCRSRMTSKDATGKNGKRVPYYECTAVKNYGKDSCTIGRVNATHLQDCIIAEVALMAAHPWRIRTHIERAAERMPQPTRIGDELRLARKKLTLSANRLDKLTEAIAVGGASVVTVLARKITDTEAERSALAGEVLRLEKDYEAARAWRPNQEKLRETLSLFGQIWQISEDADRAQLLPRLVDRVEIKSRAGLRSIAEITILPALGDDLRMSACTVRSSGELRDESVPSYETPAGKISSSLPILMTIGRTHKSLLVATGEINAGNPHT